MLASALVIALAQFVGAPPPADCTLTGQVSLDDVTIPGSQGPRLRLHAWRTRSALTPDGVHIQTSKGVVMHVKRPLENTLLGIKRRMQFSKERGRIRRETRLRALTIHPDASVTVGVLVGFNEQPITTLVIPCSKLRVSDAGPVPRSSNYLQWPPATRYWTRGPVKLLGGPHENSTKGGRPIVLTRSVPVRLQGDDGDWRYVGAAWGDDTKLFGWVRADQLEQRNGVTGGPMRGICGVMKVQRLRRVTLRPGAKLYPLDTEVPFASVQTGRRVRVRAYAFKDDDPKMLRLTSVRSSSFSLWASGTPPCSDETGIARVKASEVF